MASTLGPDDFRRQLGPFALIQRPPDALMAQQALQLGAKRTVALPKVRKLAGPHEFLFEFLHLMVVTLPVMGDDAELSVGRLPDSDLVIDDASVSKRHAVLRWEYQTDFCTVEDLRSTNGTTLNGEPIAGRVRLNDWDIISFGKSPFAFVHSAPLYDRLAQMLRTPQRGTPSVPR